MLTTKDNPWDPFDHFDEWRIWDETHGYFTSAFLARVAKVSDDLSEAQVRTALTQAMEEIVRENVSGMHMVVTKEQATAEG